MVRETDRKLRSAVQMDTGIFSRGGLLARGACHETSEAHAVKLPDPGRLVLVAAPLVFFLVLLLLGLWLGS